MQLDDLLELEEGLTDWEVGFIESLSHQRERPDWKPSQKQAATLERIWKERIC